MKYAIIGARGQVGQEFVKLLPPEQVIALDSRDLNVTNEASVHLCLHRYPDFDVVINLAAYHKVDDCEDNPDIAFDVNALGAHNVATVATEMGKKVVFFSSDYVFGRAQHRQHPYTEDDLPSPIIVYGASKVAGEHLVRIAAPDNHLIIRTSSLYGCTTSKKGWTFPEMILNKARAGEKLRVVDDQIMSTMYTRDLATQTLTLIEAEATGIYHVVNHGTCSWYGFAYATLAMAGVDHPIEAVSSDEFPTKATRPMYSALFSTRARRGRPWQRALSAYLIEKGEIK
jgi:dTDP-4-dehydrorhamnose reductase